MDQAKTFTEISPDLTKGRKEGDVSYGTISCISESKFQFGLIYAGTDDGNIQVTKNGGETWTLISKKLPQHIWVQNIVASRHKKSRVFAILNGHVWDHYDAYIYVSENYGETWTRIGTNLPQESLNTLEEDAVNEDILYVGSDAGLYISTDLGKSFEAFSNLPPVSVHDLVSQVENRDLIVGTHGRSIYKVQLEPVYQGLNYVDSGFVFLEMDVLKFNKNWGQLSYRWEENIPKKEIVYFLKEQATIKLEIFTENGALLLTKKLESKKGYNNYELDLKFDVNPDLNFIKGTLGQYYPISGSYTIQLSDGESVASRTLIIR